MSKIIRAGDQYRQNDLSLVEGGVTVTIHYTNGQIIEYDKVKDPDRYCTAAVKKGGHNILKVMSNGVQLFPKTEI